MGTVCRCARRSHEGFYYGGKSRVASVVWERFGDTANYVEPFFGSGAVLLGRPHDARIETVNDKDAYVANFWRAVKGDPEGVAFYADWPVSEADLHARHRWLVRQKAFRKRMVTRPDFFDVRVAGWWVWGISQWIGSGWCTEPGWTGRFSTGAARGLHANGTPWRSRPALTGNAGVLAVAWQKRPALSGHGVGRGVHADLLHYSRGLSEKRPALGRNPRGRGVNKTDGIIDWMNQLSERLRRVRVCCGEWNRILGPSPTEHIGVTAVFLDPPYDPRELARSNGAKGTSRGNVIYGHHEVSVSADVRQWALENGDNPKLRIALCGYEGEHEMPSTWEVFRWKAAGGYAKTEQGKANASRERIWFSPHCLRPRTLFDEGRHE